MNRKPNIRFHFIIVTDCCCRYCCYRRQRIGQCDQWSPSACNHNNSKT